jgi:aminoacyl tRNA synthase complex-interacting multifunctional protein 1
LSTESAAAPAGEADVTKLDIRVGKIISVEAHPDADSLFVEQIDVGEAEGPRTIVSGLRQYVSQEDLEGRSVVILANLKPRNMRGIKSNGMLLCASNADHTVVEPLSPPEGAVVGERVFFGEDGAEQPDAALPNQLQKKKFWEACQPDLVTDSDKVAGFQGKTMLTSAGPVVAASLGEASIS